MYFHTVFDIMVHILSYNVNTNNTCTLIKCLIFYMYFSTTFRHIHQYMYLYFYTAFDITHARSYSV